jgi:hypothetical protein
MFRAKGLEEDQGDVAKMILRPVQEVKCLIHEEKAKYDIQTVLSPRAKHLSP